MKFNSNILPAFTALLSSSCCVIQLALNFFSVSCAGFAIFTPYRHILSGVTVVLLTYNIYKKGGFNNRSTLFSVMLCIGLLISPNIVQMINRSTSNNSKIQQQQYYRIQLNGLGCEACANRIKNELNTYSWIGDTNIFFNNQTAIVQTKYNEKEENIENKIIEKIKAIDLKYDAQVLDSWVG
jgi:copper chaperone CopZ/uncharacterized membrane protein